MTTTPLTYTIGIDWGSNSLGFAAIETTPDGAPISVLEAVTHIHDGGAIANKDKTSRNANRGMRRRARKRIASKRARLRALNTHLTNQGLPVTFAQDGDDAWRARARLCTTPVHDTTERDHLLALAIGHMARHRGARNPWINLDSFLRTPYTPSEAMQALAVSACAHNPALDVDTVTQSVAAMAHPNFETLRLRATAKTDAMEAAKVKEAPPQLLQGRFMASDVLHELRVIADVQGLDAGFVDATARVMFDMGDPRSAAKERAGKDPLDPGSPRALRATSGFQHYRILGVLTTIRIYDAGGVERALTAQERDSAFTLLNTWTGSKPATWSDVTAHLELPADAIRGASTLALDGEPLSSRAPINTTHHRVMTGAPRRVREWWAGASDAERDALTVVLANSVGDGGVEDDTVDAFVLSLPVGDVDALQNIRVERDRAAYSARTLALLTTRMLATGDMPHEARHHVFGTSPTWQPPAPALHEPTGNGAVDRNLRLVNQLMTRVTDLYGPPSRINIEHVRDGFTTPATQVETNRARLADAKRREGQREHFATQIRALRGLGEDAYVSDLDIRRARMSLRQDIRGD